MCPLVLELSRRSGIESEVCLTSQHRELLSGVTDLFGVKADYDLDLMRSRQTLGDIFCGVLRGMEDVLRHAALFPEVRAFVSGPDAPLSGLGALAIARRMTETR